MTSQLSLRVEALPKILAALRAKGCKPRRIRGGWQATCPCCHRPGALTISTPEIVALEGEPAALVVAPGRADKQVITT